MRRSRFHALARARSLARLVSVLFLPLAACGGGGGGAADPGPILSAEADLASLSVSAGTLTPAFVPGTTTYAVGPAGLDGSVTVTPTVVDAAATVTVNDLPSPSGTPSAPIALVTGLNTVTVEVTAEDGVTTKTYVVHLTRDDPAQRTSWTRGLKRVLVIPVRFTDLSGPSDVPGPGGYLSGWGQMVDGTIPSAASAFFRAQSFGAFDLTFTILPEIDLGVSHTAYDALYAGTTQTKYTAWSSPGSFADDVRAKARQVGLTTATPALYDTDAYDLDLVATGFIPGQLVGAAAVGYGKGVFASSFKALPHELCHNLGLNHSNGRSYATYASPTRPGSYFSDAYGDVYCLMGWKTTTTVPLPADRDVNPYWKWRLGWLPTDHLTDVATAGTYRVTAFDQGTLEPGKAYALRFVRDPVTAYWLGVRQAVTEAESPWSRHGLEIHLGGDSPLTIAGTTILLDMTPGSRGPSGAKFATMQDAPLALGRTFSDREVGFHVTPVRKGGTSPESLDVVVHHGTFAGNGAPTVSITPAAPTVVASVAQLFTATASDPDGDVLAYAWEFDDPTAPGGTVDGGTHPDATLCTQGSHAWTVGGTHLVRCTVTDLKGHATTASATVTVTGGTAAPLTIRGVVRDENGTPLEGAVVNNFKASAPNAVAYGDAAFVGSSRTAADGTFVIPLPATPAASYALTARHGGFGFTCTYAGGVVSVSGASVAGVDFTRVRTTCTISGAIVVAGRPYDPATDGDLWVHAGAASVKATLGGWQMSVPDDAVLTLSATPDNPAYVVTPAFPNPYRVVDDFNLLHFSVVIPGAMPATGFATAGASSDDTVGTVNLPLSMTPPPGWTTWPADQTVSWWVDPSSTAEYGVDYTMSGGTVMFLRNVVPTPFVVPLKILHDGVKKTRTVVIRVGAANTVTHLGPFATYTYTIVN